MDVPRSARTFFRPGHRLANRRVVVGLITVFGLLCSTDLGVRTASAAGEDSPYGVAGAPAATGVVAAAGSYSVYTGSALRVVPDLVVPGAVGANPLAFGRIVTSRIVPGEYDGSRAFGKCASWRHSYNWGCYQETTQTGSNWRVHYPDGKVVHFAPQIQPAQYYDPYMPGISKGVGDRLENVSGNTDKILHLTTGGKVYFQWNSSFGTYLAIWIWNPFDQKTVLSYYPPGDPAAGRLYRITEPAGRYLQVTWKLYTDTAARVSDQVVDTVTASNSQSVKYNYFASTYAGKYIGLSGVTYTNNVDVNNSPY